MYRGMIANNNGTTIANPFPKTLIAGVYFGWFIPKLFRPDYGWRASGFYGCPNHLAGFLETLDRP